MGRPALLGLVATGLALLHPGLRPATAATCLDQVRALADRHRLVTDPPTIVPGDGRMPTSDDLARSGGVIEPPRTQERSVIAPPPAAGTSRMPTLPDVESRDDRGAPGQKAAGRDALDKSELQSLLMAARAQAERGNERGCLEGLEKARGVESGSP